MTSKARSLPQPVMPVLYASQQQEVLVVQCIVSTLTGSCLLFAVTCKFQLVTATLWGAHCLDPPGSHAYAKASCLRVYLLTNLVLPNSYGVPARLFLCRCVALTVQPRLIIWHESLSGLHGSLYVTCSAGLLVQFCSYFAIEDVGGVVEVLSCGAGVRHPALQV